jgi:arylsulfatase A-like enzyme
MAKAEKPNILIIWGDDIGISNLSCYSHGLGVTTRPTSIASPKRA